MAGEGTVRRVPSSISYTGTSATLDSQTGRISYTGISSLYVNGVFDSSIGVYGLVFNCIFDTGVEGWALRMVTGGVEDSGNNYNRQILYATGATVATSANTGDARALLGGSGNVEPSSETCYVSQPAAATNTQGISYSVRQGELLIRQHFTHTLTTAYDGFQVYLVSNTATGTLQVYGFEE